MNTEFFKKWKQAFLESESLAKSSICDNNKGRNANRGKFFRSLNLGHTFIVMHYGKDIVKNVDLRFLFST